MTIHYIVPILIAVEWLTYTIGRFRLISISNITFAGQCKAIIANVGPSRSLNKILMKHDTIKLSLPITKVS